MKQRWCGRQIQTMGGRRGEERRSCEVCKSVNDTSHFKRRDTNETFSILRGPLDFNSNHVIYLLEWKQCQYRSPYVGSTKSKFKYRINNYKSTHRKFRKKYVGKDLVIVIRKSEFKKKLFHEHCCSEGHQGIENWSVIIIDQVEALNSLRKKELYWIKRLSTWAPNGLNVKKVYEAYNWVKKNFFKKLRFCIHIPMSMCFKSDIAVIELKIF